MLDQSARRSRNTARLWDARQTRDGVLQHEDAAELVDQVAEKGTLSQQLIGTLLTQLQTRATMQLASATDRTDLRRQANILIEQGTGLQVDLRPSAWMSPLI